MFDRERVYLGITPTGWTNDDMPGLGDDIPFEQCVSEMALAGFEGCSVGHKYPKDPAVLKRELDLRGLRVSEPWASTQIGRAHV
jgi:inosose dehydratase